MVHTCVARCLIPENSRVICFVQFYRCYLRKGYSGFSYFIGLEMEVYFSNVLVEDICL